MRQVLGEYKNLRFSLATQHPHALCRRHIKRKLRNNKHPVFHQNQFDLADGRCFDVAMAYSLLLLNCCNKLGWKGLAASRHTRQRCWRSQIMCTRLVIWILYLSECRINYSRFHARSTTIGASDSSPMCSKVVCMRIARTLLNGHDLREQWKSFHLSSSRMKTKWKSWNENQLSTRHTGPAKRARTSTERQNKCK